MADGKVVIDTGINVKGFEKGMRKLNTDQKKLAVQMERTSNKVTTLERELTELGQAQIPTQEYEDIQKQISKTETQLNRYLEKEAVLQSRGRPSRTQWKYLQADIERTRTQLEYYRSDLQDLEEKGGAFISGADTAQYSKKALDLEKEKVKLEELNQKMDKTKRKTNGVANALKMLGSAAKSNIKNRFGSVAQSSQNAMEKLGQTVTGFIKRLAGVAASVLVFQFATKAVTALRDRIGLLLKKNQQLTTSLSQIKGNLNTAFQSIYEAALPAINILISALVKATSIISAFTAALFGKTIKASQDAAAAADRQAEATEGVGKAAKKASQYLNGYDEMNVQASEEGTGGGGGAAGGISYEDVDVGSGVSAFVDKLKEAWRNADFTEIGTIVGTKIRDALNGIDWKFLQTVAEKAGKSLATFLNGVMETPGLFDAVGVSAAQALNTVLIGLYAFAANFHWDSLGQAIAASINTFFSTYDFGLLGMTASAFAVGLLTTLLVALTNTDWLQIGRSVGTLISNIDWGEILNKALSVLFTLPTLIFNTISGLLQGMDWKKVFSGMVTGIKNFLVTFDWKGLFGSAGNLIGAALKAIFDIGSIIVEAVSSSLKAAGSYFSAEIEACGGNIARGILQGILKVFASIGKWIVDNVFVPIWNAIKKAFGIASPSKEMAKLGEFIAQGLVKGIQSLSISDIKAFFGKVLSGIKNVFSGIPSWFKSTFTTAWSNVKKVFNSGGKIFSGIKEGIAETFRNVVNKLISGINSIIRVPFNAINNMLNKIRNVSVAGIKPFSSLWSQNPLKVPSIPKLATGAVIPPNAPFLAMLGDQRNGTNIETPLNTMIEAFLAALDVRKDSNRTEVHIYMDGREITSSVIKEVRMMTKANSGKNPMLV